MDSADIERRFAFHSATTLQRQEGHAAIRDNCRWLANQLNEVLPDGREKSLAITHLEEVMFWGNAALARA